MIGWWAQIVAVGVQAPLLPIVPPGKKIPQSLHAPHKQLVDLWIADLYIKVK
jgi:hypothetical protein